MKFKKMVLLKCTIENEVPHEDLLGALGLNNLSVCIQKEKYFVCFNADSLKQRKVSTVLVTHMTEKVTIKIRCCL